VTLLGMVAGLADAGVPFVVVGGVAASAQGSARVTDDLDICYDTAPQSLVALAALLAHWHAYPREVEPGLPFTMDAQTLRAAPMMTLETSEGHLDVMDRVDGVGTYADCLADSEEITVPSTQFRVLTLGALIRAKRATGRRKDRDHLIELETIEAARRGRRPSA
jgi:hypothetical protein